MDLSYIIILISVDASFLWIEKRRLAEFKPGASEQGTTGVIQAEPLIPALNWLSTLKPLAATFWQQSSSFTGTSTSLAYQHLIDKCWPKSIP